MGVAQIEFTDEMPLSMFDSVGVVDSSALERLQRPLAEISEQLYRQLIDMSLQAANAPTVEDFRKIRDRLFPSYMKLTTALSNTIRAKLDDVDLPALVDASFDALESRIGKKGTPYFGDEITQEIVFSISTLRSAHRWLPHLATSAKPEKEVLLEEDRELCHRFSVTVTWCHFHLEGIMAVLWKGHTIEPDVLQELLDGLRSAVMAYAYVRRALDLRGHLDERYKGELNVPWDADDEALARAD